MTSSACMVDESYVEYFVRLFSKLYEDVFEAYNRTPDFIAAKPYIERALRLVQSGLSTAKELLSECRGQKRSGGAGP